MYQSIRIILPLYSINRLFSMLAHDFHVHCIPIGRTNASQYISWFWTYPYHKSCVTYIVNRTTLCIHIMTNFCAFLWQFRRTIQIFVEFALLFFWLRFGNCPRSAFTCIDHCNIKIDRLIQKVCICFDNSHPNVPLTLMLKNCVKRKCKSSHTGKK